MDLKERRMIATALGYYARAQTTGKMPIAEAVEKFGLAAWVSDVDCQVAFRKGFQEAGERLPGGSIEAEAIKYLGDEIHRLTREVRDIRDDLLDYAKLAMTKGGPVVGMGPPINPQNRGGGGGGGSGDKVMVMEGGGGGGGGGGAKVFDIAINQRARYVSPICEPKYRPDMTATEVMEENAKLVPDWAKARIAEEIAKREGDMMAEALRVGPHPVGPFYMRRADTGAMHCLDGKPVSFPDRDECWQACAHLYNRSGIACEPVCYVDPQVAVHSMRFVAKRPEKKVAMITPEIREKIRKDMEANRDRTILNAFQGKPAD